MNLPAARLLVKIITEIEERYPCKEDLNEIVGICGSTPKLNRSILRLKPIRRRRDSLFRNRSLL